MFGWLFGKKEAHKIKEDTKKGFDSVKKDVNSMVGWIKHLNSEREMHKREIEDIKEDLSSIKNDIEGIKNIVSIIEELNPQRVFKTPKRVFNKQTAVYPVQTAVQTAVQTPKLDHFSVSERAILWVLINSELKLSYDDLAAVLGKERATIRGQINTIKQKSENVIEELTEKNGKKRIFIPEEMKEKLLKKIKVSVKRRKGGKESKGDKS